MYSKEEEVFYITYNFLGNEYVCQIEAIGTTEAIEAFKKQFRNGAQIIKVETMEDISDKVSDSLIKVVKEQLNK